MRIQDNVRITHSGPYELLHAGNASRRVDASAKLKVFANETIQIRFYCIILLDSNGGDTSLKNEQMH